MIFRYIQFCIVFHRLQRRYIRVSQISSYALQNHIIRTINVHISRNGICTRLQARIVIIIAVFISQICGIDQNNRLQCIDSNERIRIR